MIKIDTKKFFEVSLIAFIVIEAITFLLSQFGLGVDLIKGGWIIFLFLIVIGIITIFNFGTNLTSLKLKDFIFMLLVLLLIVGLYLVLPIVVPQLFSIIPGNEINYQIRDFVSRTIGSVAGMMSTGIAG